MSELSPLSGAKRRLDLGAVRSACDREADMPFIRADFRF